jgi:transcriptional regulator with XRE-family HTH domain
MSIIVNPTKSVAKNHLKCNLNLYTFGMSFGKWLADKRRAAGLTQKELADYAGISANYVSALERDEPNAKDGSPRRPRLDKVDKMARPLRVTVDEIRVAAGYAPIDSAGFLFRISDEAELERLWESLTPEQHEAVKELVLSTLRSLANVSKDILEGIPVAPNSANHILKRKEVPEPKRKAQ